MEGAESGVKFAESRVKGAESGVKESWKRKTDQERIEDGWGGPGKSEMKEKNKGMGQVAKKKRKARKIKESEEIA